MARAFLPFHFVPSPALVELLGGELPAVAVIALEAVIRNRKSLEIAHQQIAFRGHHIALSTRITAAGRLVVDLDVGLPGLAGYVIPEEELRRATRAARSVAGIARQGRER
jgi:hypothetical protein